MLCFKKAFPFTSYDSRSAELYTKRNYKLTRRYYLLEPKGIVIAEKGAEAALELKANNVVVLDLKGLSSVADFFVICSGNSDAHVEGISNSVEEKLDEIGANLWHKEGERGSSWMLLDYVDVIFHIFTEESREHYGLERLWGDAPVEEYKDNSI
ncbi:ribosome silencing factor [Candidatus Poribacteria bacterium]|nr:ribosome silencing factor [Candidatus Poribacteria bacterium]